MHPGATVPPTLTADGSSFASVAIQQWVGQVSTLFGIPIDWQVTSSVIGLNTFATNQVDFAASDLPYSAGQAEASPTQPYQYLPDVGGGLSFMFNLNGTNGQRITDLNLDAQVIDDIFLGRITRWDNPAIEAINPQLSGLLPATSIIAVYRSDASGENYLLSQYLLNEDHATFVAAQTAFGSASPGAPTAVWPTPSQGFDFSTHPGYPGWKSGTPTGQAGSDNAANYVAASSSIGAITYVEPAYAKVHTFPVASLLNASGADVQPTSVNMSTALESATRNADGTQNPSGVFTNSEANAYPLSSYSYLVAPCSPLLAAEHGEACQGPDATSPFPSAKGTELGKFVHFLACAGQETVTSLGYAPLPPNLVQEDFDAIGAMNGGVQPPPPTASNCKNPYIDGQFPLPGAAVSYEEDCTTGFQTGVAAAFVTTLKGNTTTGSATPTGEEFGFTGTATTTLSGAFIANIYSNGLGSGTSTLQWTETIGSTDGHATGSYKLNTPNITEPDGGGTAPGAVTWTKGSTTLTTTGGGFSGVKVGDGLASSAAGIPQSATVKAVAANDNSITISRSTTAAAPASEAASVSWGATTVFETPVITGNAFTTNGPSGGTAGIGLVSATQFTAEGLVTFGGATGDGPSNCLLTGWTGSTPPVAGPPQTGGSSPTGDTVPVLAAGSTTPLISVSPVEVQPAAEVDLNGAPFSITVNGAATAITNFGSSATLAEVGLPTAATGTITFDAPGDGQLCAATLPATSCGTSTTLAPGNYPGISAAILRWWQLRPNDVDQHGGTHRLRPRSHGHDRLSRSQHHNLRITGDLQRFCGLGIRDSHWVRHVQCRFDVPLHRGAHGWPRLLSRGRCPARRGHRDCDLCGRCHLCRIIGHNHTDGDAEALQCRLRFVVRHCGLVHHVHRMCPIRSCQEQDRVSVRFLAQLGRDTDMATEREVDRCVADIGFRGPGCVPGWLHRGRRDRHCDRWFLAVHPCR